MKTIEELYNEVMASEELKKEFLSLKPEEVEGFAEKYGCKATLDEIKAFLTEKSAAAGELSDEEIEQVAGGKGADEVNSPLSVVRLGINGNNVIGVEIIPFMPAFAGCSGDEMESRLQSVVDEVNKRLPTYKRILKLVVRTEDFKRSGAMKILRDQ